MSAFKVVPKHWYQWINPFWWWDAKTAEAILNYQWEHGMKEDIEKQLRNYTLYGTTEPEKQAEN